ncbi:hypothetical protein [Streptosporangium canum]|uniref:hypothetical protein n=1 Tax=Streptosporangium canum TaxID=324952 RepID=UPI0037A7AE6C
MTMAGWWRAWWNGGPRAPEDEVPPGPEQAFAVRELYRRYGQRIYARAAADPAFSAAIAAREAAIRDLLREDPLPRMPGRRAEKMGLNFYLLGQTHALLQDLLDAAIDSEDDASPALSGRGDSVSVRMGAMFQLAFDGGLLTLEASPRR